MKRATGTREPKPVPDGPAKRWSLDLLADAFGAVRRFHMLDVIHDQTRKCLALATITSQSGARVARELDRCTRLYDKPQQSGFVESLATLSFRSTASCATNA
jgi:putative transposase